MDGDGIGSGDGRVRGAQEAGGGGDGERGNPVDVPKAEPRGERGAWCDRNIGNATGGLGGKGPEGAAGGVVAAAVRGRASKSALEGITRREAVGGNKGGVPLARQVVPDGLAEPLEVQDAVHLALE